MYEESDVQKCDSWCNLGKHSIQQLMHVYGGLNYVSGIVPNIPLVNRRSQACFLLFKPDIQKAKPKQFLESSSMR